MVIMRGENKMGLSTVTVSVKEFEDLIEKKKKIEEITKVVKDNEKYNITPATAKMLTLTALEKWDEACKVADKADALNLETLKKIAIILDKKAVQTMSKGYKIPISKERSIAWVNQLKEKGFDLIVEDGRLFVLIGAKNED